MTNRPPSWLALALALSACNAVGNGLPVTFGGDVPSADGTVAMGPDGALPDDVGFAYPDGTGPLFDAGFAVDAGTTDRGFAVDVPVRVDLGPPATRAGVVAGRRCATDADCVTPTGDLTCVTTSGGRICTSAGGCTQGATVAGEEAECGGTYSTCLLFGVRSSGVALNLCTRACRTGAASEATGACPAGSLCTNNWVLLRAGQAEATGCLPFCASDADCAGSLAGDASIMRCNTRLGRCTAAPFNPALLPDGSPCNPQMIQSTGVAQCRGTCFTLNATRPTQGLCGSFVNYQASQRCPDDPTLEPRGTGGDSLSICLERPCTDNRDCTGGLLCVFPEDATRVRIELATTCGYATAMQPTGLAPH
ncbi:MAG: hypothetical protein JWM10_3974 [Myxococcaceae bacterium]|nr:hypothetical protein [Myxococcaceae bacterium]